MNLTETAPQKNDNHSVRLEIRGAGYGADGDEKRGLDAIADTLSWKFLSAVQNRPDNMLIMDQDISTAVLSPETYRAFRLEIEASNDVVVTAQPS